MDSGREKWFGTTVRLAAVVLAIGAIVSGEGCDCDGSDGAYLDGNLDVQCGTCPQFAYKCTQPATKAICAPDDYSLETVKGCTWFTQKINCSGFDPDTGGGDGGLDETIGDDGGTNCGNWDPGLHVRYNSLAGHYEVEEDFFEDTVANPDPLDDCDSTRMKMVSGGFYEFYDVDQGDLAAHLGFQNGDIVKEVNSEEIFTSEDFFRIMVDLAEERSFTVKIERSSSTVTLNYEVF